MSIITHKDTDPGRLVFWIYYDDYINKVEILFGYKTMQFLLEKRFLRYL